LERAFRDINFRTLTRSKDLKLTENEKITPFLIKELKEAQFIANYISMFFADEFLTEEKFDKKHHEACVQFLKVLQKYYPDAAYGKAQKIVNMMFKHLYCMKIGEAKKMLDEKYFEHCHLTLDSFTLEWFCREVAAWHKIDGGYKITKGAIDQWSNLQFVRVEHSREDRINRYTEDNSCRLVPVQMKQNNGEKYHYMFFVDIIRQFFPTTNPSQKTKTLTPEQKRYEHFTPFQAEFYIWPEIQLHLTAEALFGQSIGQEEMIEAIDKKNKEANETTLNEKRQILDDKKSRSPNARTKGLEAEIKKLEAPVQDMDKAKAIYQELSLTEKLEILKRKIELLINHSKCQPTENQNGRT
jgi:hypothetical protein